MKRALAAAIAGSVICFGLAAYVASVRAAAPDPAPPAEQRCQYGRLEGRQPGNRCVTVTPHDERVFEASIRIYAETLKNSWCAGDEGCAQKSIARAEALVNAWEARQK